MVSDSGCGLCSAMVRIVRTVIVVLKFAALRYCEIQLQIARCRATEGSRWQWVARGGAVLQVAAPCY